VAVTAALDYETDHRPHPVLRRGRHRNRALACNRRSRAVEMGAAGSTYQQIADELGYANRGTVHRLVRQALEAQQVEIVELLRTVEVQRLDALQASLWPAALAGDVEAATTCLRIILAASTSWRWPRRARASGSAASSRRRSS
jgi:transposase-like protein